MSKKANLANEEWDFSILEKAPRSLIHRALLWELDREIGSGKEPFLKTAECRQALSNPSSLRGTATGVTELGRPNAKTRPFEEAISFGIDWSQPRDELVRQFGLWLDTQESTGRLQVKPALGKPRDALTMLRKISIVRLKKGGLSQRVAADTYPEKKTYLKSLTRINWTTASREVGKACKKRQNKLVTIEKTMGSKDWKKDIYGG
ncbi:MAG: hypothetical protein OXS32_12300 [Verrucomicrobiales bacterium]|jgi:hypothetical protein|nr:hypothetical protein [Verrucomicrobiales bacterium]|tara:strand:+ start:38 stop:652 length:615 start_codon:yes stop_codon:yes gene_type:complete